MLNFRGQEEAPFQLLVAVILMTFVIIAGLNAMQEAEKQKCFNDTERLMNDLKLAIERTATYKQPANVIFNPPGCSKDEAFILFKSDEERLCKRICINASTQCVLLRYSTSEVSSIADKCVDILSDTQFVYQGDETDSCEALPGFKGIEIDSDKGFVEGVYQFLYSQSSGDSSKICVYIKERN